MSKMYKSLFAAAMMLLVLASAGCAEMPVVVNPDWSGNLPPEEQGEESGNPGYLIPATPYPTATSSMPNPTLSRPTEVPPTPDPYVTLYSETIVFSSTGHSEAYTFDLTVPPLIIEFDVKPKMITREKHTSSGYGSKKEVVVKQVYPSENSWFTVTVRDRESGKIIEKNGFGRGFDADTRKQIRLYVPGNYLIELVGSDAEVRIQVCAGGV
ncbi:MAG: hypothetical protein GX837_09525 [Methanomicrobiales archaeon]|nr:hypothetical protein [Methanomicrobiales archaeon]